MFIVFQIFILIIFYSILLKRSITKIKSIIPLYCIIIHFQYLLLFEAIEIITFWVVNKVIKSKVAIQMTNNC